MDEEARDVIKFFFDERMPISQHEKLLRPWALREVQQKTVWLTTWERRACWRGTMHPSSISYTGDESWVSYAKPSRTT
jgi:hypothetical protein